MDPQQYASGTTKFPWFTAVTFFLCGALSVIAYAFATNPPASPEVQSTSIASNTVQTPGTITLTPPAQALSGVLIQSSDSVRIKKRRSDTFESAVAGGEVLLGESLATGPDGRAKITISGLGDVTLEESSEVEFTNLFLNNSVILQKSGSVRYNITSKFPVAVRSYHALISASSSALFVDMDDGRTEITVSSGSAKTAIVDWQNSTYVWEISQGERAIVDDASRTVQIR